VELCVLQCVIKSLYIAFEAVS